MVRYGVCCGNVPFESQARRVCHPLQVFMFSYPIWLHIMFSPLQVAPPRCTIGAPQAGIAKHVASTRNCDMTIETGVL